MAWPTEFISCWVEVLFPTIVRAPQLVLGSWWTGISFGKPTAIHSRHTMPAQLSFSLCWFTFSLLNSYWVLSFSNSRCLKVLYMASFLGLTNTFLVFVSSRDCFSRINHIFVDNVRSRNANASLMYSRPNPAWPIPVQPRLSRCSHDEPVFQLLSGSRNFWPKLKFAESGLNWS